MSVLPGPPEKPDPEHGIPLSSRELKVLAEIEHDLCGSDPRLARELAACGRCRLWSAVSVWQIVLMVPLLLLVVMAMLVLIPPVWLPSAALLITILVVPVLLLIAVERDQRDQRG